MTLTTTNPQPLATLQTDLQAAVAFAAEGRSPSTKRAYKGCWSRFEAYCAGYDKPTMPASPVGAMVFILRLSSV